MDDHICLLLSTTPSALSMEFDNVKALYLDRSVKVSLRLTLSHSIGAEVRLVHVWSSRSYRVIEEVW